ncbi:hypothetical protein evm_012410 [Chilo suppressalis]|nr:hypothetical protein evm_012410 [Chilo suppressalis]
MSTECVSIKQEVDIEIGPELNIYIIKLEPKDDVLSNTNAYSESTEIIPKFVIPQQEVETDPLFIKQEQELDVLSNTNEVCEMEEMVPEFVSVKPEREIEYSDFREEELKELKRKRACERQRAYYHRQKELRQKEIKIKKKKKVPKSNAERQRAFRERRKILREYEKTKIGQ